MDIPNISKWKLNTNIKINFIFKGCDSLLSFPDISKWNINFPKETDISSSNSIKEIKTSSLLSEEIVKNSNLLGDSSLSKDINDINSIETKDFSVDSKNEATDDYYDNFYN